MLMTEEDYLAHYGILRKSGRYPWGSGGNQAQRNKKFLDIVADHTKAGMSQKEIADLYGMKVKELRELKSIARNEYRQEQIRMAERLSSRGNSNVAIAERMGIGESQVRALLKEAEKDKLDILEATSDMLRKEVEAKGAIDIGVDVYRSVSLSDNAGAKIGLSSTKFDTAVAKLREEGYQIHTVKVPQVGAPGQFTRQRVLAKPDVQWKDLVRDPSLIKTIGKETEDGGRTFNDVFQKPIDISSKRVQVKYDRDGGAEADGLIYVRPGVDHLSLGGKRYAQVRISIDGTHYLKGMAVYKDDLPPGVDLVFNTNKSPTGNKKDAMKAMKDDPDLPFGSVVSQIKDEKGRVKSAMNLVNDEGKWDEWSRNLPTQFLSKQNPKLAERQLQLTYDRRLREFAEIQALTNPVVKKRLLKSFAEDTDAAAVHLKAAQMPKQATKVLIPIRSIKENEVYAPSFENGTRLALVRFPHGGTFEIPQVTVNNKNREAKGILGNALDAIGIHHKVAERLSGADFDGDTVLAIPNNRGEIRSTPPLEGLKGFDPRRAYRPHDGMRTVDGGVYDAKTGKVDYRGKKPDAGQMQRQMGDVSNLITDMTLKGAGPDELARAVRHSMVVIDSEKHVLDYRASARDNGILALKKKYQGVNPNTGQARGASTLISRAKSPIRVDERKLRPADQGGPIDRKTGKLVYVETGRTFTDARGKTQKVQSKIKKLEYVDDASTLTSKPATPVERIYADHSNRLKALANDARKELVNTKDRKQSASAKKVYKSEVSSLETKLNTARMNTPLERQAQRVAKAQVAQKRAANPGLEKKDIKKLEQRALAEARARTGASRTKIEITPKEWEAIQAGAISNDKLSQILRYADLEKIKAYATPRQKVLMTSSKVARAQAMLARGATQAEVAAALGVSLTTLKDSLQ